MPCICPFPSKALSRVQTDADTVTETVIMQLVFNFFQGFVGGQDFKTFHKSLGGQKGTLISQAVIERWPGCDLTLTHSRKTNGSVHNLAPHVQSRPSPLLDRSFKCSEDPLRQRRDRRLQQLFYCTIACASTYRVVFPSSICN